MFGKRRIKEYDIVDDYDSEIIAIINLDNPFDPKLQGAYEINKFNHGTIRLLSPDDLIELNDLGALKLKHSYETYDICLN